MIVPKPVNTFARPLASRVLKSPEIPDCTLDRAAVTFPASESSLRHGTIAYEETQTAS